MSRWIAALVVLVGCASSVSAADAPDFPPGYFIDGRAYSLKDLEGKAVVLFFYEQDCPRCRGEIPARNKVVEEFKGQPVRFIAVAAGDSIQDAKVYSSSTKLAMPIFADNLSLMEKRYGTEISLRNIWQFRLIAPDGRILGYSMDPADIKRAVAQAKWKYKDGGYDAKLMPAIDMLEWGQYADGVRLLKPWLKNTKKEVADSAKQLYDAVKAEGEAWLAEADKRYAAEDHAGAFDLYTKVSTVFAGEELGKKAADPLKKLAATPAMKDELAARKMYEQLNNGASRARAEQKPAVAEFAASIAKKYPNTPTGKKAADVAKELGAGAE
ncbi:MAG TPA: redoxin domain-containing protein [Tepidisphaeraceae bacterium]|nr:redoxin domain-containing protein [Tepidisphaeraceae bacterium]